VYPVAIVPAHNEAPRITRVVSALVRSGRFGQVIVVDDGSTDDTGAVARATGATVLTLTPNRGKGDAMRAAVARTRADVVCFFDADLVGLEPEHVGWLLAPVVSGRACMTVGLMDHGIYSDIQRALPLISGQRCVRREVLARIPDAAWSGFGIEAAMNAAASQTGCAVETVLLRGVSQVSKWHKVGAARGISDGVKMLIKVLRATRDYRKTAQ